MGFIFLLFCVILPLVYMIFQNNILNLLGIILLFWFFCIIVCFWFKQIKLNISKYKKHKKLKHAQNNLIKELKSCSTNPFKFFKW